MTRQKEFDVDQVLDRAIKVFWERGYESASMRELQERMGIGRQSIYDTFGDKHALFLAALNRYNTSYTEAEAVQSFQEQGALRFFRGFFSGLLDTVLPRGDRAGCLTINTIQEFGQSDPEISKVCQAGDRRLQKIFTLALEWGRDRGEFARDLNVKTAVNFLSAQRYGLSTMAKQGVKRSELDKVVDMALGTLLPV